MPGSTPATSQLDWLSSTTAMIVLSWSKATRDLLKSFSWGIGALRQLFASDDGAISSPPAPYHLTAGGRWIRNVGPAPWRGQGRAALLDIRRGMRHGVRCRAFPCSAGRYDRAYPFGGDGHPSTDKLVGASGV